jgi:hypothetical protein
MVQVHSHALKRPKRVPSSQGCLSWTKTGPPEQQSPSLHMGPKWPSPLYRSLSQIMRCGGGTDKDQDRRAIIHVLGSHPGASHEVLMALVRYGGQSGSLQLLMKLEMRSGTRQSHLKLLLGAGLVWLNSGRSRSDWRWAKAHPCTSHKPHHQNVGNTRPQKHWLLENFLHDEMPRFPLLPMSSIIPSPVSYWNSLL